MDAQGLKIIVGLGNPGVKYGYNRHNIGFMVVDAVADRLGLAFRSADASYAVAEGEGLVLIKPLTYMNRSGEAFSRWQRATGWQPPVIEAPISAQAEDEAEVDQVAEPVADFADSGPLVVCDDLALPLGSVRLRPHGSSGGQNGLGSLIAELGTDRIPRLRLGIAPLDEPVPPEAWPDYVLADFAPEETTAAQELVDWAVAALSCWREEGFSAAVSRFNRRIRPGS